MDDLIVAIALLAVGVLGMGWLNWSARSTRKARIRASGEEVADLPASSGNFDVKYPDRASPKIVAFCGTPSTMFVREDMDHVYVTYMVEKRLGGWRAEP